MKIADVVISSKVDNGVKDFINNNQALLNQGLIQFQIRTDNPSNWGAVTDGEIKLYFTGSGLELWGFNKSNSTWYQV